MTDPIVAAAEFLAGQIEYARHQVWADEFLTDVEACLRIVRSVARGPAEQRYLGPCGAERCPECGIGDHDCIEHESLSGPYVATVFATCDGDVYAREGAQRGRCTTCGAEVAADERRAWLDEQVRASDQVYTAKDIGYALSLNAKTIRAWANERRADNGTVIREARLKTYWRSGEHVVPWMEPADGEDVRIRGHRLHYVADVLALATEAAARRAENGRVMVGAAD